MNKLIPLTAALLVCVSTLPASAGHKGHGHRRSHHGGRHHHHGHRHHHHRGHVSPVGVPVDPFVFNEFVGDPLVGEAEVIRSLGEYNLNTSEAAINVEEARRRAIENRKFRIETRNQLKQAWLERRRAKLSRKPRPQPIREVSRQKPVRKVMDKTTGLIAWPRVLLAPQFEDFRAEFDGLAGKPQPGGDFPQDVSELGKQMEAELKLWIGEMPAGDYIDAKKFIIQLVEELQSDESNENSMITMFQ